MSEKHGVLFIVPSFLKIQMFLCGYDKIELCCMMTMNDPIEWYGK